MYCKIYIYCECGRGALYFPCGGAKTDDNDKTHENDTNTLSWHMVNASFWASAS